jgi:glycosyltransferase involved in cell wall biosynthesis
MPDLTLVIACYNEEPILEDSLRETFAVLDALRVTWEVIFVDDASHDRTREIIDRVIVEHPSRDLRRIFHTSNVGRGGTVADGMRAARGRYVGYLDIDLEVHARYILPCLLALESGYHVATALRVYKFYWRSLDRYAMSRGYRWLMRNLLAIPLQDTETGFKFFRRDAIMPVLSETQDPGWFWDTEIMVRAFYRDLRIVEIPVLFVRRFDKHSSLNPFSDTLEYLVKLWRFRAVGKQLRQARL